jgi:hypothetical protein
MRKTLWLVVAVCALVAALWQPLASGARPGRAAARTAATTASVLCSNKAGSRYVKRVRPTKCAVFGPHGSFGGGVNLSHLKWHGWGHSSAHATGHEDGFHLPPAATATHVTLSRLVKGHCGRVYTRLRSTSRFGTTRVKLAVCPKPTF